MLLLIVSISILLINLTEVIDNFSQVINDAEDVVAKSYLISKFIPDMETGQRGFVITGEQEFLEPFKQTNKEQPYRRWI